jgi:hypothetical protein
MAAERSGVVALLLYGGRWIVDVLIALLIPIAVALVAAVQTFGGRFARAMSIGALLLALFYICWVLVHAVT